MVHLVERAFLPFHFFFTSRGYTVKMDFADKGDIKTC